MSTNIEIVTIAASENLRIQANLVHELFGIDELPEDSFIADLEKKYKRTPDDQWLDVTELNWYGEGSGHSYDTFTDILSSMEGTADIVIVWEGGEIQGLKVTDTHVLDCEVGFVLTPLAMNEQE